MEYWNPSVGFMHPIFWDASDAAIMAAVAGQVGLEWKLPCAQALAALP